MTSNSIPREEIPWYPTVSAEKCNGCQSRCHVGAASFPDIGAIYEVIRKLRER
jgi:hypothetical protein